MARLGPLLGVVLALAAGGTVASEASERAAPALFNGLYQSAVRVSRALDHVIEFDVADSAGSSDAAFVDAAVAAGDALVAIAGRPGGLRRLERIHIVRMDRGAAAGALVDGRTLVITINPALGVAGRPSTADIDRAIAGN